MRKNSEAFILSEKTVDGTNIVSATINTKMLIKRALIGIILSEYIYFANKKCK